MHGHMEAAQLPGEGDPDVTLKAANRNAWDRLFNMTQDKLCTYLGGINADDEFIANIVSNQIDGARWVAMFTTPNGKVVDSNESKEIIEVFASDKTPQFFKIKVRTHLTLTLQSQQQSSCNSDNRYCPPRPLKAWLVESKFNTVSRRAHKRRGGTV